MSSEKDSVSSVEDAESSNKRLKTGRDSVSSNQENVAGYMERIQENVAGYVERIHLKNFMCHDSLEISLNKKINFIVGRNGSGKSAILAAVVIALGCKASSTNRASSLKDFVKNGASYATVEVTLCNEGLNAYEQEVYGSKIIVVRKIFSNNSSSSYKFKSAKGDIISTNREELDKIIVSLKIQVDNPISVLNQETARTFLFSSDPKQKYSFFMKATKLEDCEEMNARSLNHITSAKNRMKMWQKTLLDKEKEIEEFEKKVKILKKLREVSDRSEKLQKEYYWALARDEENSLLKLKREIEQVRKVGRTLKDNLEAHRGDLKEKMKSMREELAELQVRRENMKEKNLTLVGKKAYLQEANSKYRNHMLFCKQLRREILSCEHEIEGVKEELVKQKDGQENLERKKSLIESIEALKVDEKLIAAAQKTTEEEYENLRGQLNRFREQENDLKRQENYLKRSIDQIMGQLKTSQTNENNLAVYGKWMPRVIEQIEEWDKKGMFVRKPLGPLGVMLRVNDPEWAHAIESELQGLLRYFACHCSKDAEILQSLFKKIVDGDRMPGIFVSKFIDRLYDIRETSVKVPGYKNVFDALHFTDVNVANILIDNKHIETTLLIPTDREAGNMMSKDPPTNCEKAITKAADIYLPYPDFRTYAARPRPKQHVSLLKVSKQELIRQLEEKLKANDDNMKGIKDEIMKLSNEIKRNQDELGRVAKRIKELRDHRLTFTERRNNFEAALEKLPDPQHFLMLNSELQILQEKVRKLMEKLAKADLASDVLKNDCDQAAEVIKNIQAEINEIQGAIRISERTTIDQKETVMLAESKVEDAEGLFSQHTTKINKMLEMLERKEKQTEEAVKSASNMCPERILSNRDAEEIKGEISDAKMYLSLVEEGTGVTADISDVLEKKKQEYKENMEQFITLGDGCKALHEAVKQRSNHYALMKKVMELRVQYVFKPLLYHRGYQGDLYFDHEARTLEVSVSPKQEDGERETISLSGGERSFSTVSLILALWDCAKPPFYFMDEFDVFLDRVNRNIVIEMLLSHARQNKKHQYVFITPQDISAVHSSEDITILKLDDPERATPHTQES